MKIQEKNRSQHLKETHFENYLRVILWVWFLYTPNIFSTVYTYINLLITRSILPRYSIYRGQVMKYKVKQTSFLNWSWQRASARIILLTTQNKRGTLCNLIYPAIKWLLSHLHELFFSEIYYFTFHDMVHHSTLWGNIRTVKYNVLSLATSWDLKHWGNKDFKSLATVCRGKQWFIHIDDILLFKNDAIEFE